MVGMREGAVLKIPALGGQMLGRREGAVLKIPEGGRVLC